MAFTRTVLPSLVALVVLCLVATGMYQLYGGSNLDLTISKRSLEKKNKTTPTTVNFPKNYHATGRLFLPHSNIVEPFEIWFSSDFNRSRIDYYYGTDKTYQRADLGKYGVTFKVVPMHTEKDGNYIGCWKLEGHKGWPIIPQPIVPNMSYFKYASEEVYMGTPATRWEYRYMVFGLLNTHTLLVSKLDPVRPVRYEMKGYDSLMASYYDNYVLEYISFEEWKPDMEKFELPKDQWCYNWSHSMDSHFVSNPMGEFMSYGEDIVDEMYHVYKEHHNKIQDSKHEHVKRKHIFRHNMRYIRSINRQNLKYKLAPNHLVDLTDDEYDGHAGLGEDNSTNHKGGVHLEEHHEAYSNMSTVLKRIDVPDELDWREYGAVTSVRGQGICGSCYALGAVGSVEGAYFMKTGQLVELSAQQIVDCSWGSGNHGCRGGWYNKALSWIYMNGVAKAKNYGPYLAQEGTCETLRLQERIKIDAFAFVPKYNNSALKRAIAKYGPACVSINQKPLSLKFYSWGIYDNPECDNSSTRHTVLVVGYGKEKGVPYWLVKNSWSSSWGLDGYIKLAWKDNICGVTKNPVVALFKHTTFQFPVKEKIDHVNPLEPNSMGRKVHAQHKPGFHGHVNGSSFHGNINSSKTGSLLNSSAGNGNETNVRRKLEQNASSSSNSTHRVKLERRINKTVKISNVPENRQSNELSVEMKVDDSAERKSNFSVLRQKSVFHAQKLDETVDKTVEISSSAVKTQKNEFYTQNSDEITDSNSPINTQTNVHYIEKIDKNPDRTVEMNNSPLNTKTNELYASYDANREGEENLVQYATQRDDEITGHRDLVYNTPEQADNVIWDKKSSTFEPEYYYPSYAYNTEYNMHNPYPVEYRTQEGLLQPAMDEERRLSTEENVEERSDKNRWLHSQYTTDEVDAAGALTVENAPSPNLQKPHELLSEQDEDSFMTTAQPTTPSSTTAKEHLKRTVKSKPTSAPKSVRHYSGKLQDIYDKLEEVIASSWLKKHRPLSKNHKLKGY